MAMLQDYIDDSSTYEWNDEVFNKVLEDITTEEMESKEVVAIINDLREISIDQSNLLLEKVLDKYNNIIGDMVSNCY